MKTTRSGTHRTIDYAGGLLLAASTTAIVYWCDHVFDPAGPDLWTYLLPVLGAAALAAFVAVERRAAEPIIPLGLFAKSRVLAVEDQLLVFPRRGMACTEPPEREGLLAGDGGNPRRRDGTGDVLGLRELTAGEDARRVHWMKSAAAGKLLKVEREREEVRRFVLEVDGALAGDALEHRCEEAAALSHRLLHKGHEVGLTTPGSRIRPAGGPGQERRVLSALAWVGFEVER